MRNPDRIPLILKELEMFWKQNPDWRLAQILANIHILYTETCGEDIFYMEDDLIIEGLKKLKKYGRK